MTLDLPAAPDQAQRDLIVDALDTSMLVEAAAGTGKTTSMVARMVALVAEGRCPVESLAAVTFTRKAAAQLRARFRASLEKAVRRAQPGDRRRRLAEALDRLEQCFMGTIHSFCGRLLRERPVEAGVPVDCREMEDEEDRRLREIVWREYVAELYAAGSPLLALLAERGLEIGALEATFIRLADFPDVPEWPVAPRERPDLEGALEKLGDFVSHARKLLPVFPEDPGTDKLMPAYRDLDRRWRHLDRSSPASVIEVFERFGSARKPTLKCWHDKAVARAEGERWARFRTEVALPLLAEWREYGYEPVLRCLRPALDRYDERRLSEGFLNFGDLLMRAAALLRDNPPAVRQYFRRRFTHLLVDEFQDTDPIQAEVMMLLTASDPAQTDWRRCRPAPGALFVVGDPKQSIYRFRRADIVTYNVVRDIIEDSGGLVVTLSANFRTVAPINEWVNRAFRFLFPAERTRYAPAYVPLQDGRVSGPPGEWRPLLCLEVPDTCTTGDLAVEYEADAIARLIRAALDRRMTVERTLEEEKAGVDPHAHPGDFMLVTKDTKNLAAYGHALQAYGIPHQVTGGSALAGHDELALLHACLAAVAEPDNPVSFVAVLRGPLFGFSDRDLYAIHRAGGTFRYTAGSPDGLDAALTARFDEVLQRLVHYAEWLDRLPPAAAAEAVAGDLGLFARAASAPDADGRVGGLAKAIELLRLHQQTTWTAGDAVVYLGSLVGGEEAHDGMPALPQSEDVVRVMNLHKAKGLEAPIVFLACPRGRWHTGADIHVDRQEGMARGFLQITEPRGEYQVRVLAQPPGWDAIGDEEKEFGKAENVRLQYVAATRAGSVLCLTRRLVRDGDNPWSVFAPHLDGATVLEDPGPQTAPSRPTKAISDEQVKAAGTVIRKRWDRVIEPTYVTVTAREGVVYDLEAPAPDEPRPPSGPPRLDAESARLFGVAVHALLEAVARNPETDAQDLADVQEAVAQLAPSEAARAVSTVRQVMASGLWARAMASERLLVEVPFEMEDPQTGSFSGPQRILRGVIDLTFREDGGWVVVDWKTDAVVEDEVDHLLDVYAPQLSAYQSAWSHLTGEEVKEVGLYLTSLHRYASRSLRILK